jgi:hypothetical protein
VVASPAVRQLLLSGRTAQFTPLSLPGLADWYDFSDLSTLFQDAARTTPAAADADPLGGMLDKSGNGRHLSQSTSTRRPALKLAVQNGRSVARFDGVDDHLAVTYAASLPQPNTLFVVSTFSAVGVALDSTAGGDHSIFSDVGVMRIYAGTALASAVAPSASAHVFCALFNGASSVLRRDRVQIAAGNAGTGAMLGARLGASSGLAGGYYLGGDISEAFVVPGSLSAALIQSAEAYLKSKWATP